MTRYDKDPILSPSDYITLPADQISAESDFAPFEKYLEIPYPEYPEKYPEVPRPDRHHDELISFLVLPPDLKDQIENFINPIPEKFMNLNEIPELMGSSEWVSPGEHASLALSALRSAAKRQP